MEILFNGERCGRIFHGADNVVRIRTPRFARAVLYTPEGKPLLDQEISSGTTELSLGPLMCPPWLRYRSAIVEWRGYGLKLTSEDAHDVWFSQRENQESATWKFRQPTLRPPVSRFAEGAWGWMPFQMETAFAIPVTMRLSDHALRRDWLNTRLILSNPSSENCLSGLSFHVVVCGTEGTVIYRSAEISAETLSVPQEHDFGVEALDDGKYFLRLEFHRAGRTYRDAPEIIFHKETPEKECCRNLFTQNFLAARSGAIFLEVAGINTALQEVEQENADALTKIKRWEQARRRVPFQITAEHPSALFIECGGSGCAVSIHESTPRVILPDVQCCLGIFSSGDFTVEFHSLFSHRNASGFIKSLSLVPLNELPASPGKSQGVPFVGINDWAEYFSGDTLPQPDQIGRIIEGQRQLGIGEMAWSVARSWVEYRSELPQTSRWPVVPLEEAAQRDPRAYSYAGRTALQEMLCPLREALQQANHQDMVFTAWMALNSHYHAAAIGGICCSKWFQTNPRFHQWRKGAGKSFPGEVCYYFQEVRWERIAILEEIAGLGVNRFLLDGTRQPRVALYHPEMTAEYQALTGVNPLEVDETEGEKYDHWIQWRSGFFTKFLRELRQVLSHLYPEKCFHLSMRIPQCGMKMNLASGFDVQTWLREGLIERLYLNPLEIYGGGLREIDPYVREAQAYGVEVYGEIGQTWTWASSGVTAALHRADSLFQAGVDGIGFYECELLCRCHPQYELISHLRNEDSIRTLLENSNIPACHPFDCENAMLGYDNHSRWDGKGWRLTGFEENCL